MLEGSQGKEVEAPSYRVLDIEGLCQLLISNLLWQWMVVSLKLKSISDVT